MIVKIYKLYCTNCGREYKELIQPFNSEYFNRSFSSSNDNLSICSRWSNHRKGIMNEEKFIEYLNENNFFNEK